ncbi:MAG: MMPL family transporter [Bacteroidales bacterium]|nr:MMPL family transporter [Bacteroidales bacterium]MCF8343980.1 MMPL family transporter [Bacteroidales bacterium]MCF8351111.1 MMPL family transporter [Bacteroidales bacterium]MCF8376962.1 MMPL family transporter [Bacteroidales bacterium]MCF8401304.1 MMPL family transporter [Bacteroidales bacterium]
MWTYLVRLVLRYRLVNIIIIGLITLFMAYKATQIKLSYKFTKMLPATDTTSIIYEDFKLQFGEDGSVMFIGIEGDRLFELETFNDWYELTSDLRTIEGVEEAISIARLYRLKKNDTVKKFDFVPIVKEKPETQQELDSLKTIIYDQPFYEGLLMNTKTGVSLVAITLDKEMLNTKNRVDLVYEIKNKFEQFSREHDIDIYYSGLPYIRTLISKKVEDELQFFIYLALIIASVILLIFFRSIKAVFFTMLIVIISVVWVMGTISLLGYKITMLTGILPPLLIVIVVENCIFLLNKYHTEYRSHGNKIKALSRVVQRIGNANFLTNTTTAVGFAAFIVTGNKILVEFGLVASLNIMFAYLLTLFLIPIFFSYLKPPKPRHIKHLESSLAQRIINWVVHIVQHHRNKVYLTALVVLIIGIYGITKLETTGNIVDDIPKQDPLYQDLLFIEKHFDGVMPLEIAIDTKKERGVLKLSNIKRIQQLQDTLATYEELSKPLSIAEVIKSAKQAFYGGNPKFYELPNRNELSFMVDYIPNNTKNKNTIIDNFVDTNLQITRISVQMKNIGTHEIARIKEDLRPKIDAIFPPDRFDVQITGTSVVFLKGTRYLTKNLFTSLLLALAAISILMALLFSSPRMIGISLIPNLIPQIMTAGMMGYLAISIKPSTILIFSIALGISVDNAIHFLSRYRLQLKITNWNIKESVIAALRETGYSMLYSSVVLFFGFIIFTLSSFGGTESMGYLISFTLLIALLSNLFVLPSLLLSLNQRITTKRFSEPLIQIFDEEEDIDLDELEVEEIDTRGSA